MHKLISELKQHALMTVSAMKRDGLDSTEVNLGYQRVKSFPPHLDAPLCPSCWVRKGEASVLVSEAEANESTYFRCKKCGFHGVFPKIAS